MPPAELAGCTVLITRPAAQAQHLVGLVEAAGGDAIRFPTIEILPVDDTGPLRKALGDPGSFHFAIFVSTNAVDHGLRQIRAAYGAVPSALRCIAIGDRTARALREEGVSVVALPVTGATSEALLAHPVLKDVADRRVLIVRGVGGRELLAATLRERGADVVYAECYRRDRPSLSATPLIARWRHRPVEFVTFTSVATVDNLVSMLGPAAFDLLPPSRAIVLSERIAAACERVRMPATVAPSADDAGLMQAMQALWSAR